MFSVLFEVHPRGDQWDSYLEYAKMLRPELEQIDGFVDNIRYGSLTRDGWILSLSGWQEEKALVRWRTRVRHHEIQVKGRTKVLSDYHLRVGQITEDTELPEGQVLVEQRLDETEVGEGTTVTLLDAHRDPAEVEAASAEDVAGWLGLDAEAPGLLSWDVFNAVLRPGDVIAMLSWRAHTDADAFRAGPGAPNGVRLRQIRVVRDYGMYDRRENPQYYPDIARA
ncbi:MAG: antibiotic biosynthesis monooxygenase [Frankiales bacterium]|nr:antibiotic biosynthesis monooxygenase [Frankiales bacterium]